jgi:hypothetical protein
MRKAQAIKTENKFLAWTGTIETWSPYQGFDSDFPSKATRMRTSVCEQHHNNRPALALRAVVCVLCPNVPWLCVASRRYIFFSISTMQAIAPESSVR